jgi:hypothetical protein
MGDQNKKGGGSHKIGRNKKKCEQYRFSHGRADGNKKPKGVGNLSTRKDVNVKPYMDDLAFTPEDRIPQFKPYAERTHICTEFFETEKKLHMARGCDGAEDLARHIRPHMRGLVLFIPKEVTVNG